MRSDGTDLTDEQWAEQGLRVPGPDSGNLHRSCRDSTHAQRTTFATSSGSPNRPNGTLDCSFWTMAARCSGGIGWRSIIGVLIGPGATTLMRIPSGESSAAIARLIECRNYCLEGGKLLMRDLTRKRPTMRGSKVGNFSPWTARTPAHRLPSHSTVTLFARFRGLSTSQPNFTAR